MKVASPQSLSQLLENQGNYEECPRKHRTRGGETHDFEITVFAE